MRWITKCIRSRCHDEKSSLILCRAIDLLKVCCIDSSIKYWVKSMNFKCIKPGGLLAILLMTSVMILHTESKSKSYLWSKAKKPQLMTLSTENILFRLSSKRKAAL